MDYRKRRGERFGLKNFFICIAGVIFLGTVAVGGEIFQSRYFGVKGEPSENSRSAGVYSVYASPEEVVKIDEVVIPQKTPEEIRDEIINNINKKLGGKLTGRGWDFYRFASERNMDPYLMAAISIHETGNGTSKAIHNKNNVGGLMVNGAYLKSFISVTSGIEHMIHLLHTEYFNGRNFRTIEQIGSVYCPVGVKNDPNGLNKNWVPRVKQIYKELSGGVEYVYKN